MDFGVFLRRNSKKRGDGMGGNVYLSDRDKELIHMLIDYYSTSVSSLGSDETLENELMNLDTKIAKSKKRSNA